MSKNRKERLRALVDRYESNGPEQNQPLLAQEEFDDLLNHYYEQEDYDRTLEVADLAVEQHPFCPEYYKWKALIHKINLQEDAAFAALEKLSLYAPNDEEALMLRLEILTHFSRTEDARQLLDQLRPRVSHPRKESLLTFFDGLLLLQEFRYEESFGALCDALRLDPRQEPALEELMNAGEFIPYRRKLLELFDRLLNQDPFNEMLWYYRGLWHDDEGRDEEALDNFGNARALAPGVGLYDLEYADKLFDLERYAEALRAYAAYLRTPNPEESYETYMRIGRSYQILDRIDDAKQAYFRAAELNSEMYDIFQHLGECFALEQKWGIAAYNYGRAVEREGHTPECWLGLGLCHAATNETEEAEFAFQKAIGMDDRYSDAIVAYAVLLVERGEELRALDLINAARDRYEDGSLAFGAVAVYLMSHRRKAALELLTHALTHFYHDHELLTEFFPNLRDDDEVDAIFRLYGNEE